MNAASVVAELCAMGVVVVVLAPSKIRLIVETGDVPSEAIALALDHKPELIEHLRLRCRPHNNPGNYLDTRVSNRPGWIRSTCRVCGRFIGYRRNDAFR